MGSERTASDKEVTAAEVWLRRYATSKQVLIAYHADPDGAVAATLIDKYLSKHLGSSVKTVAVRTHEFDFAKLQQHLEETRFDALVALDINFASRPGFLAWLANDLGRPALIYDDHLVHEQPAGPEEFCYINPMINRQPVLPVPACFFAYLTWSGKKDAELDRSKLPDLVDLGLFGESVLQDYVQELRLPTASVSSLRMATRTMYALYASVEWPTASDPILGKLRWALDNAADAATLARAMTDLDEELGGVSRKLDEFVRKSAERIVSSSTHHKLSTGGDLVIGQVEGSEFLAANLTASNVRNLLDRGVAIAYQQIGNRMVLELRRTRNLKKPDLDSVVERVAHMDGIINSGGHPPAAGLAVESSKLDEVLTALTLEVVGR